MKLQNEVCAAKQKQISNFVLLNSSSLCRKDISKITPREAQKLLGNGTNIFFSKSELEHFLCFVLFKLSYLLMLIILFIWIMIWLMFPYIPHNSMHAVLANIYYAFVSSFRICYAWIFCAMRAFVKMGNVDKLTANRWMLYMKKMYC